MIENIGPMPEEPRDPLQELYEDYRRRLSSVDQILEDAEDPEQVIRLRTKEGCYRAFLSELQRLKKELNQK